MKQSFKTDIAMLRLFAITTVVAFHTYGMCYAASHLPTPLPEIYKEKYEWVNQYIPINVAMPLFVFISGYLFGMQLMRWKYQTLWQVAKDKFMRLGVPYYVFLPIMMATYSGFNLEPYFTGDYWHLWFLPGIWWSFVATYCLHKFVFSNKCQIVVVLFVCLFILTLFKPFLPHVFGLHYLSGQLYYFVLGTWICRYEEYVSRIIDNYYLDYPLIVAYLITIIWFPTEYGEASVALTIGSTSAVLVLWYLFRKISWERLRFTSTLLSLSVCSFGIYIFHNWVAVYLVSTTAKRLLPIGEFAGQHILLFPILFTVVTILISYLLTKILLSLKIGRCLIG